MSLHVLPDARDVWPIFLSWVRENIEGVWKVARDVGRGTETG